MSRRAAELWPWVALALMAPVTVLLMPHRFVAEAAFILLFVPLLWAAMACAPACVVAMTVAVSVTRLWLQHLHDGYMGRHPSLGEFLAAGATPVALYAVLAWAFLMYRRRQARLQERLVARARLEMMGRLAGGLAHDVNNVLAVILGTLQLTRQENADRLNDSQRADLDVAVDAAKRGSKLIEQMLRAPRGDGAVLEDVDLNRSAAELARKVEPALGPGVQVELVTTGEALPVRASPTALYQLLLNLSTNARDAMSGSGTVEVHTERRAVDPAEALRYGHAAGEYATLKVIDHGRGMTPRTMSRIFKPFYTTKPPEEGTGLGLVVVDSIVRQHEGFLDVQSELGKGTTFTVFLPLRREPFQATANPPAAPSA